MLRPPGASVTRSSRGSLFEAPLRITQPWHDQRRGSVNGGLGRGILAAMAELEDHAIQRDRGFVVKLVLALVIGALAGSWALSHLTSDRTGEAGAQMFGYPSAEPATD
jgi:hypothetical protein